MFSLLPAMPPPKERADADREDQVVLFPSLGHWGADGHWHLQIHGDIFTPVPRVSLGKRFLLRMLQRVMRVPKEELESELFQRRIARFLARDAREREIAVHIGDQRHELPARSRRNGHFHATLRLPAEALNISAAEATLAQRVQIAIHGLDTTAAPKRGQVYLLPPRGLSIISDIDDTIKHSHVACRRTLLTNTFLREFAPISGMAAIYRDWAERGAAFHYVSSSPWQMYEHLAEHFIAEGLPPGSFHLRWFRLRDHLLRRLLILRRSGKITVIQAILKTFPNRQFILIGDSGEKDPEIYGALARKFPQQVRKIMIREIPCPRATPARFQKAFRNVPPAIVQRFFDPAEIAASLNGLLAP